MRYLERCSGTCAEPADHHAKPSCRRVERINAEHDEQPAESLGHGTTDQPARIGRRSNGGDTPFGNGSVQQRGYDHSPTLRHKVKRCLARPQSPHGVSVWSAFNWYKSRL